MNEILDAELRDRFADIQERDVKRTLETSSRVTARHAGWALILVATASLLAAFVRVFSGTPLGSDAYSHLVWARDAVNNGLTSHSPYDYTVPKPLEQLVAVIGHIVKAPVGVFTWWTMLGAAACVLAAGALARRSGIRSAGGIAALLAICLPVLWRGAPAGDSNVPYAAFVVGAAAAGAGTIPASGMLALAGILRPEAWPLAVINAIRGWRGRSDKQRAVAASVAVLPPILWAALDKLFTGDLLYAADVLARYKSLFGHRIISLSELPHKLAHVIPGVTTWPTVIVALAALVVVLWRRPLDVAVVFPLVLVAVFVFETATGRITEDSIRRMLTGLAVFAAAGAGATTAWLGRYARGIPAVVLVIAIPVLAAVPLRDAAQNVANDGARARELEDTIGPRLREKVPDGFIATPRQWQGALSLYSGSERSRFVLEGLVADANSQPSDRRPIARRDVKAFVLPHGTGRKRFFYGLDRSAHWNLWHRCPVESSCAHQ